MTHWMSKRCPSCGLAYRRMHAEGLPSWKETYWELRQEHDRRIRELGDYHLPARRSAVLGRRFAFKQALWAEHVVQCTRATDALLADLRPRSAVHELPSGWPHVCRLLHTVVDPTPVTHIVIRSSSLLFFPSWPIGEEDAWILRRPVAAAALTPLLYGWAQARASHGSGTQPPRAALVQLLRNVDPDSQHPLLLVRADLARVEVLHGSS